MQEFHGELLIGGMRLEHVQGELEEEFPDPGSADWILAGQLRLPPDQKDLLEVDRQYRLQLEDGRGGLVVLSCIDCSPADEVRAKFQPRRSPK